MILKYDVYYSISDKYIEFKKLIPSKKRWRIRYNNEVKYDIEDFLYKLSSEGFDNNSLKTIFARNEFIYNIYYFLRQHCLVTNFNSENFKDSPYRRQLEVFDAWDRENESALVFQKRLSKSKVLIIGAGGVGTSMANILSSCGVGTIYIADYDCIEISNLSRQYLYTPVDIGKLKVDVIATKINDRKLGKIIPINAKITYKNIEPIIKNNIEALDIITGLPFTAYASNKLYQKILELNIPLMCVGEHDVGPLLKSIDDLSSFPNMLYRLFEMQKLYIESRTAKTITGQHPSYLPEISIAASISADEIIRYLSNYAPMRTTKGFYSIDPIKYEVRFYDKRNKK